MADNHRTWDTILADSLLTILTFVATFIAFYEIYPYGHALTIALVVGSLILWSFINLYKNKFITFPILTSIGGIAIATGFGIYTDVGPNPKPETETHGWLLPGNEPTPNPNCGESQNNLVLDVGGNALMFRAPSLAGVVLQIDNTPVIAFQRENEKLIFDVDVYNDKHESSRRLIEVSFG